MKTWIVLALLIAAPAVAQDGGAAPASVVGKMQADAGPGDASELARPQAVLDEAVIAALKDRRIVIVKPDGSEVRGILLGGTAEKAVVQIADGRVLTVSSAEVASLRVENASPTPPSASASATAPAPRPASGRGKSARELSLEDQFEEAQRTEANAGSLVVGGVIVGVLGCGAAIAMLWCPASPITLFAIAGGAVGGLAGLVIAGAGLISQNSARARREEIQDELARIDDDEMAY